MVISVIFKVKTRTKMKKISPQETTRRSKIVAVDRILELTLANVVGDVRTGMSTRAQLKHFVEHQAHIWWNPRKCGKLLKTPIG